CLLRALPRSRHLHHPGVLQLRDSITDPGRPLPRLAGVSLFRIPAGPGSTLFTNVCCLDSQHVYTSHHVLSLDPPSSSPRRLPGPLEKRPAPRRAVWCCRSLLPLNTPFISGETSQATTVKAVVGPW